MSVLAPERRAAAFLAVFFGRASKLIRARFGPTAYIDHSGPRVTIADKYGRLGAGETLRAALQQADATHSQRQPNGVVGHIRPLGVSEAERKRAGGQVGVVVTAAPGNSVSPTNHAAPRTTESTR